MYIHDSKEVQDGQFAYKGGYYDAQCSYVHLQCKPWGKDTDRI